MFKKRYPYPRKDKYYPPEGQGTGPQGVRSPQGTWQLVKFLHYTFSTGGRFDRDRVCFVGFRVLTPTNSRRTLITNMEYNTGTICLNNGSFGTHEGTNGFSSTTLTTTIGCYRREGIGICLALGALYTSSRVSTTCRLTGDTLLYNISTFVVRSVNITRVIHRYFPRTELRTSARVDIVGPTKLEGLGRVKFYHTILPERVDRGRVLRVQGDASVRLRVFIRNTLYVDISKRYCLSTVVNNEDKGEKLYTRPYHLPFSTSGDNDYSLDLGSLDLIHELTTVRNTNIFDLGVRNEVGHPRCITTTMATIGDTVGNGLSRGSRFSLQDIFDHDNFADNCFSNRLNGSVFNAERGRSIISTTNILGQLSRLCSGRGPLIPVSFGFRFGTKGPTILDTSALKGATETRNTIPRGTLGGPLGTRVLGDELSGLKNARFCMGRASISYSSNLVLPTTRVGRLHHEIVSGLSRTSRVDIYRGPLMVPPRMGGDKMGCVATHFTGTGDIPHRRPFGEIFVPV